MKKTVCLILAFAFIICTFAACGESDSVLPENESQAQTDNTKKLNIVTTIFPEYDWVMQILGEKAADAEVTMLLDNGVDLHSYQPTAEDIMKISTCDMFVYVGGESDEWVEDALKEAVNENMVVINLLEALGDSVKNEEIVEGMEHEHDEENHEHEEDHDHEETHDESEEHDHDHEHEEEKDEHVWLSLKNAGAVCETIAASLCTLDPDDADTYNSNLDAYKTKLADLDKKYADAVSAGKTKTLLFGDRFPFRYLTDDYGLDYYAAFAGCSAESEASFETITFLAGKVDELGLKNVLTIEKSDRKIAETIKDNTKTKDQKILTLDSMQSATMKDAENGTTYLSVMESNLEVVKAAVE